MSNVSIIARGTARDYDAFVELSTEVCDFVARNEPDTLRYECHTDPATGQFVWHEIYTDDQALLKHFENLMSSGLPQRVAKVVTFEGMTALGVIEDEEVLAGARGLCAQARIDFEHFTHSLDQPER